MLASARHALALFTAFVVAILGSAAVLLPAAHADNGGNSSHHAAAPDKSQGDEKKAAQATKSTPAKSQSAKEKPAHPAKPATPDKPAQPAKPAKEDKPATPTGAGSGAENDARPDDPAGNNGTVKLAGFEAPNGPGHASGEGSEPRHPSNDPHLPCDFSVEWYGFDAAATTSTATFEQHAPTRGGDPQVFNDVELDEDSQAGGGSTAGFDGVQDYSLTYVGDAHPQHGYHVKLTTETVYSQGSDRKHKVFWVEPCETPTAVDDDKDDTETEGEEEETDTEGEEESDEDDTEVEGVQETGDDSDDSSTVTEVNDTEVEVAGVQAQAPHARTAPLASVPTVVAGGLGEEMAGLSRSPLPLGLVLLGLGLVGTALYRRVRA